VVVEKSTECEFLADAVEDLWDRVGVRWGLLLVSMTIYSSK
jgi:hypothetical protein